MTSDPIDFQARGPVAVVRLNRPRAHNAVNDRMMDRLEATLDQLDTTPSVRAVVLTGAGSRTFCAGGDLRYFARLITREQAQAMSRRMQALLQRLSNGRRVVIAAVNGQALGGGVEILTACHLRLAVPTATFACRHAANGVTPGWGGGRGLYRLVGRGQALRLLLTAETIDAEEARRIGLIHRIVPQDSLIDAAQALGRAVAKHPLTGMRGILALDRAVQESSAALAERETELFADLFMGRDFRRLLSRFLAARSRRKA